MTFQDFLDEKGIKLVPWQEKAANDFLAQLPNYQGRGSGKTFLMRYLSEFIEAHGNSFEVKR